MTTFLTTHHTRLRWLIVLLALSLLPWVAHPALATTFTVTNLNDSGPGSLRAVIAQANSTAGTNTVTFDATLFATSQTITLSSTLAITQNVIISAAGVAPVSIVSASTRVFNFTASSLTAVTLRDLNIQGTASDGSFGGLFAAESAEFPADSSRSRSIAAM